MDDKTIIATLQDWSDALTIQSFANDAIRTILWTITKGLGKVLDMVAASVGKIYSLMGFVNYDGLSKYMNDLQPIVFLLLIISIAFFGFYLLTRKGTAQINIFQSLIAIILIITIMPMLSMKIGTFSQQASKYAREKYTKNESTFTHIVDSNVIDLTKIDNTKKDNIASYKTITKDIASKGNNIKSKKDISQMNINEYMNYSDNDYKHEDLWKNELSTDGDGKATLQKMSKGHILDVLKDYYYRYHVNWGTMLFSILAMAVALLFTALKSARIIFEIGFHQILGPFVAVTDLATGQRIKEFIRSLLSLFAALFLLAALMGVYFIGIDYLNSKNLNTFTLVICELALAWMVIDGPNIVERIIGIDIGLKNAQGMLVGMWAAGRSAKGVATGAVNAGKAAAHGAKKVGSGMKTAGSKAAGIAFGHKGKEKMQSIANDAKEAADKKAENAKSAIGRASGGYGLAGMAKNGIDKAKGKVESAVGSSSAKAKASGKSANASGTSTAKANSGKADAKANASGKSAAAKKNAGSIAKASADAAKAQNAKASAKQNASSIANAANASAAKKNASSVAKAANTAVGAKGANSAAQGSNAHLAEMDKQRRASSGPSPAAVSSANARKESHTIGSGVGSGNGNAASISTGASREAASGTMPQGAGGSGLNKTASPSISTQAGRSAASSVSPAHTSAGSTAAGSSASSANTILHNTPASVNQTRTVRQSAGKAAGARRSASPRASRKKR